MNLNHVLVGVKSLQAYEAIFSGLSEVLLIDTIFQFYDAEAS